MPEPINLHDPALAPVIRAAVLAYEAVRQAAAIEGMKSGHTMAVSFDPISNAEDDTPFGYCPKGGETYLYKHGTVIAYIDPF